MVWSLVLCPDDAKQDPVVYSAEFGLVFLAKGPRTASIQEDFDCLGLYLSCFESERHFRLVVELAWYRLMRIQHRRVRPAISTDMSEVSATAVLAVL